MVAIWEPENEPRFESNPKWLGRMVAYIKKLSPNILVADGGPEGGDFDLECLEKEFISRFRKTRWKTSGGKLPTPEKVMEVAPLLDVMCVHHYTGNLNQKLTDWTRVANEKGKMVILEEFGFKKGDKSRDKHYRWVSQGNSTTPTRTQCKQLNELCSATVTARPGNPEILF